MGDESACVAELEVDGAEGEAGVGAGGGLGVAGVHEEVGADEAAGAEAEGDAYDGRLRPAEGVYGTWAHQDERVAAEAGVEGHVVDAVEHPWAPLLHVFYTQEWQCGAAPSGVVSNGDGQCGPSSREGKDTSFYIPILHASSHQKCRRIQFPEQMARCAAQHPYTCNDINDDTCKKGILTHPEHIGESHRQNIKSIINKSNEQTVTNQVLI